jgi:hypothetical protein
VTPSMRASRRRGQYVTDTFLIDLLTWFRLFLAPVPRMGIPGATRPIHRRVGDAAVLLIPRGGKALAGGDCNDCGVPDATLVESPSA